LRIQTRIFLGILVIIGISFYVLVSWMVNDLKPQYRKITEESLIDTSRILSSIAAMNTKEGKVDIKIFRKTFEDIHSKSFSAKIYDFIKQEVDFRVYITDTSGKVIFDSDNGRDEGKDYSQWIDVRRTLRGEYGARTSRENPGDPSSIMYIASPIIVDGRTIGVLSVGKPTRTANRFVESSKKRIVIGGTIVCFSVVLIGLLLSRMLSKPIQQLTAYANSIRDGKRDTLPKLGNSEVGELGEAFEEMRDALEGKKYVENYVQTLTHEVKSPLSAIQGAVELLKENMPQEQQAHFLSNIKNESERIKTIVEKLLLLSSLESKKNIHDIEHLNMNEIIADVRKDLLPLLDAKKMVFEVKGDNESLFEGDRFLIRQAVVNLLQNAIDFSPEGGKIIVNISNMPVGFVELSVQDGGSGIPEYALEKVFERFYSLKRPDTGRKSSGLGLSLVKEVALLHQGTIALKNAPDKGVIATLRIPVRQSYPTA
jgi:two-component system, OmpR family, sensor histidine kinase CreC